MAGGVADWGPVEIERLAEYLTTLAPAGRTSVSGLSSWEELATVDVLLAAMSFYSAHQAPLLRLAIELAERLDDPQRAGLMPKLLRLAYVLHERSDPAADDAARRAVAIALESHSEHGPELAKILRETADCVSPPLAVEYLTRAMDIEQRVLLADSQSVLALRGALARRMIQSGRRTDGRRVCLDHVDSCVGTFGPESSEAAEALDRTARVLTDEPDAIEFARRALVLHDKILGDSPATARSEEAVAALLEAAGEYAEAETHLRRAAEIYEKSPAAKVDLERLRQHLTRFETERLRSEARGREWDHAIALADGGLAADASLFDLAIGSLLQAARIFSWPLDYSLLCEAAVLLAGAGRIDEASDIARTELAETPTRWEAAAVYVAIAHRQIRTNDKADALGALRQAAAAAQAIPSIYERADAYPAVLDLFEAIERGGLTRLASEVATVLDAGAMKVFVSWRDALIDAPNPPDVDDRVMLAAVPPIVEEARAGGYEEAMNMARGLENAYAGIGSLIAIARIAADHGERDRCEQALLRGLDLLFDYSGEEADRTLIYHEDYRFAAAHGLGIAVRRLLDLERRLGFAGKAIERSRLISDAFAGSGAVVAAGEAARPFLDRRQQAALLGRCLTVGDWELFGDVVIGKLLKNINSSDLVLALHGEPKASVERILGQFGERARGLLRQTIDAAVAPDSTAVAAAQDRIDQVMRRMLIGGDLPLESAEIDILLFAGY